eukprot:2242643-Rhodomonas_salina.3
MRLATACSGSASERTSSEHTALLERVRNERGSGEGRRGEGPADLELLHVLLLCHVEALLLHVLPHHLPTS